MKKLILFLCIIPAILSAQYTTERRNLNIQTLSNNVRLRWLLPSNWGLSSVGALHNPFHFGYFNNVYVYNNAYLGATTINSSLTIPQTVLSNASYIDINKPINIDVSNSVWLRKILSLNYGISSIGVKAKPFNFGYFGSLYSDFLNSPSISCQKFNIDGADAVVIDGSIVSFETGNVKLGKITSVIVDDAYYNAFPGLVRFPNGTLYVVYRVGTAHGGTADLYSRISTDRGATWSSATLVYDPGPTIDPRDVEMTILNNGKILMSYFCDDAATDTVLATYTRLGTINVDNTVSWAEPVQVPDVWNDWTATTSKAVELHNGTIILPVYGMDNDDTYMSAGITRSITGGESWGDSTIVATEDSHPQPEYNESGAVQLANGRIVMILRSGAYYYYEVHSDDNGATWTDPDSAIASSGLGRPTLLLLPSGGIFFMSRGPGNTETIYGVSWDDGTTWTTSYYTPLSLYKYMYGSAVLQEGGSIASIISWEQSASQTAISYQEFYDEYSLFGDQLLGTNTVHHLEGWITSNSQNPFFGYLPENGKVLSVDVWVSELFNSDGTDLITVGYDGNVDAYGTSLDVSSTGVKTITLGATSKTVDSMRRAVEVYYTNGGTEPTTGKTHISITWIQATISP